MYIVVQLYLVFLRSTVLRKSCTRDCLPVSLRLVVLVFLLVGLAGLLTRNRLVDSLVD